MGRSDKFDPARMLEGAQHADPRSVERLFGILYDELRRLASVHPVRRIAKSMHQRPTSELRNLFGQLVELGDRERKTRLAELGESDPATAARLRELLLEHDQPVDVLAFAKESRCAQASGCFPDTDAKGLLHGSFSLPFHLRVTNSLEPMTSFL